MAVLISDSSLIIIKDSGRKTGKNGNDGRMTGKLVKKCNVNAVIREIAEPCCKRGCIFTTSPQTVLNKRTSYWGKSEKERAAFVYQAIEAGRVEDKGNLLMVDGVLVCSTAWCRIHGIVLSSFYEKLAEIRRGDKKGDAPRQRKKSLAYNLAEEWFRNFARNADYMPNSSTRALPSCLSKLAVYQLYTEEMAGQEVLTRSMGASAWRLKTHVTGVLTNYRSSAYAFIDLCEWPHDSNLTINVILQTLLLVKNSMGHLAPVAYFQMDNCWRENKNQFVLAFMCMLVEMGVFQKIKLCYLMVGHTHEDIDQMFSCVARRLLKKDALTLEQLKEEITKVTLRRLKCTI
ncbi:Exocyst complex component 1 [Desmophyllum pertusum]|uniref:Exocyst complex component 1 n=1 Tax=Desmophyllum pertusum TaxID=174260 RepID=A0A9W9ZH31_9CNID|nr:Exocyst complex component 1 [Desmophyllum pertusum]